MMLIGFGFLMTFLKRHGYGSIGFNFLLTCFVIEWSILINGFFKMIVEGRPDIAISIERYGVVFPYLKEECTVNNWGWGSSIGTNRK